MSQIQIHDGRIKQQTVQQVEYPADAREELAGVLHPGLAFEERFNQIPNHGSDAQDDAENNRMFPVHAGHFRAQEMDEDQAGERRDDDSTSKTLPGLAGADAGNHLVPADQGAGRISARVAELRDEHEVKQVVMAINAGEEIDLLDEV